MDFDTYSYFLDELPPSFWQNLDKSVILSIYMLVLNFRLNSSENWFHEV